MTPPPKDTLFLADIGYSYYVLAHWSKVHSAFVYTNLQCDLFEGEWQDYYFENEHFDENKIKGWIEVPKVKR